jgi:hypothetical protein
MCVDRYKDKVKNVQALVKERSKEVVAAVAAAAAPSQPRRASYAGVSDEVSLLDGTDGTQVQDEDWSLGLEVMLSPSVSAPASSTSGGKDRVKGGPTVSVKFPCLTVVLWTRRLAVSYRIEPTRREGLVVDQLWSDRASSDASVSLVNLRSTLARRNNPRYGVSRATDDVSCLGSLDSASVVRIVAAIPPDLLQPTVAAGVGQVSKVRNGALKFVSVQAKPKLGNTGGFGTLHSLALGPPMAGQDQKKTYDESSGWTCSLILGGTSSVRICSVALSVTGARGLMAIVHPLVKHAMQEPPTFLAPMLNSGALHGAVLGFMSGELSLLVTGAPDSTAPLGLDGEPTKPDERGKLVHLREPLPVTPTMCTVTGAPDGTSAPVVIGLTRGQLSLMHGVSGRSLPPPGNSGVAASASHTCIASTSSLFAIGYKNGRVAVYEAGTLRLLKLASCHKALVTSTGEPLPKPKKRAPKMRPGEKGAVVPPPAFKSVSTPDVKPYISIMRSSGEAALASLGESVDMEGPVPDSLAFVCQGGGLICTYSDGSVWLVALNVGGALAPALALVPPFVETSAASDVPTRRVRALVDSCCTDDVTRYMTDEDRAIHQESYVPDSATLWGVLYNDASLDIYQTDLQLLALDQGMTGTNRESHVEMPRVALESCSRLRLRLALTEEVEVSAADRAAAVARGEEGGPGIQTEPLQPMGASVLYRTARNGSVILSVCAVSTPRAAIAGLLGEVRGGAEPHSFLLQGTVILKNEEELAARAAENAAAARAVAATEAATKHKSAWDDDDSSIDTRQSSLAASIVQSVTAGGGAEVEVVRVKNEEKVGGGGAEVEVGEELDGSTGVGADSKTVDIGPITQGTMNLAELTDAVAPPLPPPPAAQTALNEPDEAAVADSGSGGGGDGGTDSIVATMHQTLVLGQRMRLGVLSQLTFSAGLLAVVGSHGVRVYDTCPLGEKAEKDPNRPGNLHRRISVGAFQGYSRTSHHSKYPSPVPDVPQVHVRGGTSDADLQLACGVTLPTLSRWERCGPIAIAPDSQHTSNVSIFAHRPYPQSLLHLSCHFNEHMRYVMNSDDSDSGDSDSSDDDVGRKFVKNNMARLFR